MTGKTALITGVTGQDGRFAARALHGRGYRVVGTSRYADASAGNLDGVAELRSCALTDLAEVIALVREVAPAEIYNFAAFSTGSGMFDAPLAMGDVNAQGPVRLLEAIRQVDPAIRFCQASSSEIFGPRSPAPQSELTPADPRSPYGAAKLYAHSMIDIYRSAHGLFACSAILFNHESELRTPAFVTRKITRAAARISAGLEDHVTLGDMESRRDWGFAGDYVEAMQLMLQADEAADYVVASGTTHSVRDLANIAFAEVGLDYRNHVRSDLQFKRQRPETKIVGDPAKLHALGWRPRISFEDLVRRMVRADLDTLGTRPKRKEE